MSVKRAFTKEGALAKAIAGFSPRDAQIEMSEAVDKAIKENQELVVEAGTGTGKTFAYLVPALLCEKKVIISTGTKNLQEQLYHRDLPTIKNALGSAAKLSLLKGRSNYLCEYRLEQHNAHTPFPDPQLISDLQQVKQWSNQTQEGDIGELTTIAEDSSVFPYVTSTADNCLGKECPYIEDCYLVKARKKALESDLVVVNHHLFFADMALKDVGFGELIPNADVVIFDEAHQIPEIANEYFGESVSTRQLADLCRDIEVEYKAKLNDARQLLIASDRLNQTAQDFRLCFQDDPMRGNWRDQINQVNISRILERFKTDIAFLYDVIKINLSRSEVLDNCFERFVDIRSKFNKMLDTSELGFSYWYETTRRHVNLHITPLSIADKFGGYVEQSQSGWVFTSATLSVDNSFEHYTQSLGLNKAQQLILDSPFDYQKQAILCVPRYLPEPNHYDMELALLNMAKKVIAASKGRCFFLFTSYRMLNKMAASLETEISYPLLVQGSTSKRLLLDQFTELKNAVLLATSSFWEGVDVRGDALSCVIIDKLPFASPDEPLLQARSEDCRLKGGDPFAQVQVPQAVIALKQGVGRLIRDVTDKGALIICDNRLVTRQYGQQFVSSLPDMQRTRDLDKVLSFLKEI